MRLLKEETIINNAATITALIQNCQFFSFRSSNKVIIIAAQNLGHAMYIAQSINLGPCTIETLDQKDGCTMYVQQYLSTKARETA